MYIDSSASFRPASRLMASSGFIESGVFQFSLVSCFEAAHRCGLRLLISEELWFRGAVPLPWFPGSLATTHLRMVRGLAVGFYEMVRQPHM
jgi:hypothetical protein